MDCTYILIGVADAHLFLQVDVRSLEHAQLPAIQFPESLRKAGSSCQGMQSKPDFRALLDRWKISLSEIPCCPYPRRSLHKATACKAGHAQHLAIQRSEERCLCKLHGSLQASRGHGGPLCCVLCEHASGKISEFQLVCLKSILVAVIRCSTTAYWSITEVVGSYSMKNLISPALMTENKI